MRRGPLRLLLYVALGALAVVVVSRLRIRAVDLVMLACVVPSIIVHEVSHGYVALLFGDDTAKRAGRLTLNPLRHVDPFGTILLPVMLLLTGLPAFGYAKPVPVNVGRLRSPRNQGVVVSLAGPAVNIAVAAACALALRYSLVGGTTALSAAGVVTVLGLINTVLAAFNLIPIPPLDGSAVVERLLPARMWPQYLAVRRFAMPVLIVVVLVLPGGLGRLIQPAISLWQHAAGG
ncbi:MAG: site-2 protease family protein [Actinomycetota bacterium]|nr:site-2 protease family protein [Actinomycetota bacterium]